MTSEVEICNKALGFLGEARITSLEDPNQVAELCRAQYPTLRDAVISARMWRFAIIRKVSETTNRTGDETEDPDFPEWGEEYVHVLPTNFLQVFRAFKDTSVDKMPANWQQEGRYVISTSSKLYLQGVQSVSDTSRFAPLFVECLAARLAADLAIPITRNASLMRDMWTLYNDKIAEASVRDGQQGRAEKTNSTTLTGARNR